MTIIDKEEVYIDLESKYSVDLDTHVYVKDIGEVYSNNESIKKNIESIRVYNGQSEESYDYISGIEVTTKILGSIDNINITMIGAPDVLLEMKSLEKSRELLNALKVVFVMVILFLGASMAIINFYEDVDMKASLEKVFYIITGNKVENPLILTISFSLGIGLGMFSFFSRIFSFSKRRRQEPGPMEVELFLYDNELEDFILNQLKKK